MNLRSVALALFFLLSWSFTASAFDLSGQSRTYLQTRQLSDGTQLTPLYEYLNVRSDNLGMDAVSFSAGGWYRYYLQSTDFDKKDSGDLQYAYLTIRKASSNAYLNIGRVLVNEGAVSSQLDGAAARTDLRGGFTIGAFGGVPLETDADTRTGDSVYGGRIAHSIPGIYTIGASYLREKNDSKDFRKEEGLDVWLRPFSKLELMGTSLYNAESKDWMQHQYHATIGPFAWLRLNLDASKTWYKEYFASVNGTQSTLMSAFSFTNIDPNEIVTMTGGSVVIMPGGSFTLVADYRNYDYVVKNGSAIYSGGSVAYAGTGFSAGAALHRMNGPTVDLRYDEQRVYVNKKIAKADITLDVVHVAYDQVINNVSDAWSGSAALGYSFTPKVRVVVDTEYLRTLDFERDVRGMLTLLYSFDLPQATKAAPTPAPAPKPQTQKKTTR
jgi:hypothetical protein